MTTTPTPAEQAIMSREAKYMRKRIRYDYRALCRRARDQRMPYQRLVAENSDISNKPAYVRHGRAMEPFMFKMKLKTLASYADAVTRLNVNSESFFFQLMVMFGTLPDHDFVSGLTIITAGNLAYLAVKSKRVAISKWAVLMLKRLYYATTHQKRVST